MKWINLILFGIIILFYISNVMADDGLIETYKPNEKFDLTVHLSNSGGDILGANCTINVRNSTYGTIQNSTMNEINGGLYNYSYNNSQIGKYFCIQNCNYNGTQQAETCDFIIKGDVQTPIAIILVMGIAITFLFVLSRLVNVEAIKYLLISVAVMLLVLTINIAMLVAKDSLPTSVYNLLSTAYLLILYTVEFLLGLGVLFLMIYYVVKWLPDRIKMKGVSK